MRIGFGYRLRSTCSGAHLALLALVATAACVAAQNPTLKTRPKEQVDQEYLAAHRITLNVQVADGTGNLVPDLAASEFSLLDNNQPRKIAAVHMIDGEAMNDATEVLIVLDAVNSTAPELQQEREAIFKYLARSHGPLPFPTSFALWFNGQMKAASSTTDRNALGRAFVSITKNMHSNACAPPDATFKQVAASGSPGEDVPKPTTEASADVAKCLRVHFRDSISALDSLAQQQRAVGGRTILIWVGPGWPLLSEAEVGRLTAKAQTVFFRDLVGVLDDLRDAQVTLDAIEPPDSAREKEFARVDMKALTAGTHSEQNAGPASLALPVLAAQTGGRALTASSDITADLLSCIRDAAGYYAVSFLAMPAISPHEFHRVEVKVNRQGVDVRTLTAYYAEP